MKYEKFPIASLKKRRCACNRRMWMTYPPTVYQPTTYQMPVTYFSQKQWFIQYEQNIPRTTACVWWNIYYRNDSIVLITIKRMRTAVFGTLERSQMKPSHLYLHSWHCKKKEEILKYKTMGRLRVRACACVRYVSAIFSLENKRRDSDWWSVQYMQERMLTWRRSLKCSAVNFPD